jgi:enterobactin synthetase component D
VRAPDILPPTAVVVCADPSNIARFVVLEELPQHLKNSLEKRPHEFLAARWCAGAALQRLGIAPHVVRLGVGGHLAWPPGVVGSTTHTRRYAAAAVGHAREFAGIGIDAEAILSPLQADRIQHRLAAPREVESTMADAGVDRLTALTLVWSAKEALYKCLFPRAGRAFEHLDSAIDRVDPGMRTFRATLLVPVPARWSVGSVFEGRFEIVANMVHTGVTLS